MGLDIKRLHAELLADLDQHLATGNKSWTAFPWIVLGNMTDGFPRFFVEPPSVDLLEGHSLAHPAYIVTWNIYYIQRYTAVRGTNPFSDVMGIIQDFFDHYQDNRNWCTGGTLHTTVTVASDNAVNSWARDLRQPFAAIQFILQAGVYG